MRTDAELASAIAQGETAAWAEVYDRHRDAVWRVAVAVTRNAADAEDVLQATFLKAVERFDQLRDHTRIRPWLLAIARSDALDRVRRVRPSHLVDEDLAPVEVAIDADLRRVEIGELVRAAFDGLAARDRLALELAEHHECSGEDLARILDVTVDNAYVVVRNARERFARSVEAVVVARVGADDCADLRSLLQDWDGTLTTTLRKRLARHIDECETCSATRDREVVPSVLLGALPPIPLVAAAADRVREAVTAAAPSGAAVAGGAAIGTKVGAMVAAAVVVVAGAVITITVVAGPDDAPVAAEASETSEAVEEPTASAIGPVAGAVVEVEPTATPTAQPTATPEPEAALCDEVAELEGVAAGGPADGTPASVETYMRATNDALGRVADVADIASVAAYADAYQTLIDSEAWLNLPGSDDPGLRALRDAAQADLAVACPTI